ncbi:glycosyltransferase family 2 protein [Vibrio sp. TRT 17S01]|uniref:glycosyltransferase family 2 protein n=1 Tax=Vibrio sp. TRT 17S01 TaxID=3418505 RepID=UPI003CF30356
MISVIVPYFNDSPRIHKCLTSILEQDFLPSEIILVDDFSDDSDVLLDIIDTLDFGAIKFTYLRNSQNMNGAFSRNRALDSLSVHSEYCCFLDADDFWDTSYLKQCISSIGECDFIYSSSIRLSNDGEFLSQNFPSNINSLGNPFDLVALRPPIINTFFFKRNVASTIRFDEKLKRHQDYQYLIEVIISGFEIQRMTFCSAYYFESHRPKSQRINYDSMLLFWDEYRHLITKDILDKKLLWSIIPVLPKHYIVSREYDCINEIDHIDIYRIFFRLNSVLIKKTFSAIILTLKYQDFSFLDTFSFKKLLKKYLLS